MASMSALLTVFSLTHRSMKPISLPQHSLLVGLTTSSRREAYVSRRHRMDAFVIMTLPWFTLGVRSK
jgi:hypothetical protein